jgi:hypothetical protein
MLNNVIVVLKFLYLMILAMVLIVFITCWGRMLNLYVGNDCSLVVIGLRVIPSKLIYNNI